MTSSESYRTSRLQRARKIVPIGSLLIGEEARQHKRHVPKRVMATLSVLDDLGFGRDIMAAIFDYGNAKKTARRKTIVSPLRSFSPNASHTGCNGDPQFGSRWTERSRQVAGRMAWVAPWGREFLLAGAAVERRKAGGRASPAAASTDAEVGQNAFRRSASLFRFGDEAAKGRSKETLSTVGESNLTAPN